MAVTHGSREVAGRTRSSHEFRHPATSHKQRARDGVASSSVSRRLCTPSAFLAALVVLAVAKAALTRYFALDTANVLTAITVEAAFIVLVLGAVDLIPPRRSQWLDLAAYSLLSLLMLVITIYVAFYSQLFDPHMLSVAGQLGTVGGVVGQLVRPVYVIFVIDIPVLAWWSFAIGRRAGAVEQRGASHPVSGVPGHATGSAPRPQGRSRRVAALTAIALVVFVGQLLFTLRLSSWIDGVAIAKARGLSVAQTAVFFPKASGDYMADAAMADEVDASPTVVASSVPTTPATPGSRMQASIEKIRGACEGARIAAFAPGAFAGKNVIIIQVEALNTMVMQQTVGGQEITPSLNKLIGESWYFPNTYSETGMGNTADAEFVANSSMYTPRGQAAPVTYADRAIPALPRLVAGIGYDAFTLHQNVAAYWNRKELYPALGFARYYDAPFFQGKDVMGPMGPSDEVLFSRGMEVLRQMDASSTPYYAQFVTLSAHAPFQSTPESRRPLKTPTDLQGSVIGKYISAESYSDFAIGTFIEDLKTSKIWDKSIVIIYGDHTAMLGNKLTGVDAKAAEQLLGRQYGPADRQRVPLIVHVPGQTESRLVTTTAGQVDIMPTVADLLGIDLTAVPHMGRSVFVDANALVPLRSYLPGGTFVNGSVVFMPGLAFDDGSAVKMVDSSPIAATDREKQDFQRVLELTAMSDKWVLSLPKRTDAGRLRDALIPDVNARKAAASYRAR